MKKLLLLCSLLCSAPAFSMSYLPVWPLVTGSLLKGLVAYKRYVSLKNSTIATITALKTDTYGLISEERRKTIDQIQNTLYQAACQDTLLGTIPVVLTTDQEADHFDFALLQKHALVSLKDGNISAGDQFALYHQLGHAAHRDSLVTNLVLTLGTVGYYALLNRYKPGGFLKQMCYLCGSYIASLATLAFPQRLIQECRADTVACELCLKTQNRCALVDTKKRLDGAEESGFFPLKYLARPYLQSRIGKIESYIAKLDQQKK